MLPSSKHPNTTSYTQDQITKRSAYFFDHYEYCRLLHVLCDSFMTKKSLEDISRHTGDYEPWQDNISSMFGDIVFSPTLVRKYPGGVKMIYIGGLSPQFCRSKRSATLPREKIAEFREWNISAVPTDVGYVQCNREIVSFAHFSQGVLASPTGCASWSFTMIWKP